MTTTKRTKKDRTEQPQDEQQPTTGAALALIEEEAPEVRMFRPDELEPWPGLNPRMIFDPTEQAELDKSVRVRGIKQPILVHLREDGKHWIVMGERRWRSATNTGRMVHAIVGTFTQEEAFELALIENIQRANLNPIEEGRAFKRWLDQHPDADQYVLAEKIDKSQPYISFRLNLLRLPGNIQRLVSEGLVSKTQARDAFLPFAEIPEAVRGGWEPDEEGAEPPVYEEGQTPKVFDAVEMAVRVHYLGGGGKLNLPQLQAIIGTAALPHSKPLTQADADASEERPLFDASDHAKKCKCNGPRWMYRRWGNDQGRCFGEYWQKKQDAAKRAQRAEQEERRRQEEARRKEAEERLGDDAPTVPARDARRLFPDAVVLTDSTSDFRRMSLMVDPALIPANAVRVVKSWQPSAAYSLICTDREAMNAALTAGREARAQLIARLTTERITQEREGAAKLDLRKPDVFAELLTTLPKVSDAFVATVARQHGLKGIPEHGIKLEQWLALDGKELQLFTRALVLRIRSQTQEERQRMHDPISAEVNRLLLEQYNTRLDTLRSSVQLPRPAFAERLDDAVARFYEAHNPLAQQAREGGLSESAGEAIHALAGIVEEIRTIRREAHEAGEDPTTLIIEDVEERFTDLEAAYQRQHGPQAEEQDKGAPEGAPAPAAEEAPAPAEEEQQPAPAAEEAPAPAEEEQQPAPAAEEAPAPAEGEQQPAPAAEEAPAPAEEEQQPAPAADEAPARASEDDPADELAAARKKARRGRGGK